MKKMFYCWKVRLFPVILIAVLLLTSFLPITVLAEPAATEPTEAVNLALGKEVTTSGNEGPSLVGSRAVDGELSTRWSSAFSDPQWIVIDLGEKRKFSKVVLNWEAAYGKAYDIQVSDDNIDWKTIYSTEESDGGIDILKNLKGDGRYVRMFGRARALQYGYSLWELGIFESSEGIEISGKSTKAGNIYHEGEKPYFSMNYGIDLEKKSDLHVSYKVLTSENRNMFEKTITLNAEAGGATKLENLDVDVILPKGTYTLAIEVVTIDGKLRGTREIPFSIISAGKNLPEESMLGVCTHFAQGVGDQDTLLPLAKNSGIGLIRDEYYWANVEKEKGVYTFGFDGYIDSAIRSGLEPLVIFSYGNKLYDGGGAPETDEAIKAFTNYAKALAEHLKGKVKYFEVWNEWNGGMGNEKLLDAKAYVKVLKAVNEAVKTVNPDAYIVGGASVLADYGWVEEMLKAGGGAYMDAYSYHPYSSDPEGGSYEATITEMKDVLEKNGFKGASWVTEIGWSNGIQAKGGVTELQSASYLVQTSAISLANQDKVDKVFFYELLNGGTNKEDGGSNFGLLTRENGYPVKTGYIALQAFSEITNGAKFEKAYKLGNDIRIYKFTRDSDKKDILVAWTTLKDKTVGLKLGSDKLNVIDIMGNSKEIPTQDKVLNTTLTNVPVYLEGNFSDEITLENATFKVAQAEKSAVPGDTLIVDIERSSGAKKQTGNYELEIPDGWKLVSEKSFKKGSKDQLEFQVPEKMTDKSDLYILPVNKAGEQLSQLKVTVEKVDSFAITAVPIPVDTQNWDRWQLNVNLRNNYSTTAIEGGSITLLEPKEWADGKTYSYEKLNAGTEQTVQIPLASKSKNVVDKLKFEIKTSAGETYKIEKNISFLASAYAESKIEIDGNITDAEWQGAMEAKVKDAESIKQITDWAGADDLSMSFKSKWDSEYLYLAVTVRDNKHFQPYKGSSIWQADGLQISTEPNRTTEPGTGGWNELGFALNSEDNSIQKYRWTAIPGQTQSALVTHLCAIQRVSDKETLYEIAMPWAELMPIGSTMKPGSDVGFSMLANDNDGEKRRGWIEYMSGIGLGKNPTIYGDLVLVDASGKFVDKEIKTDSSLMESKLLVAIPVAAAVVVIGAVVYFIRKRRINHATK